LTVPSEAVLVDPTVTMWNFVHRTRQQRVVFGSGTRQRIAEEATLASITRAMVVSTAGRAERANELAELLGDRCQLQFPRARMHTPVVITNEAVALAAEREIDGIVAVGGGSAIGLAKAIALRTGAVQIVLPTTYSGSEMTDIVGQTAGCMKQTTRDPKVLPDVIVYDVELTSTLPPKVSITSGANAMAHALEGLYAEKSNPLIALIAEEGIRALASALPRFSQVLDDISARGQALSERHNPRVRRWRSLSGFGCSIRRQGKPHRAIRSP
jgi:maleylacetate reductase